MSELLFSLYLKLKCIDYYLKIDNWNCQKNIYKMPLSDFRCNNSRCRINSFPKPRNSL